MPQLKSKIYTSEDYWNLPEGERAELIDGQLYAMTPPLRLHQRISSELSRKIGNFVAEHHGNCQVYAAPFAVNLNADDQTWVEPDISVICDPKKLTDQGCCGAPDFIVEIVSPASRKIDYLTKSTKYESAGVREYWIVDPEKERTTVYRYEEDAAPVIFPFSQSIQVGIYSDLSITIADLL